MGTRNETWVAGGEDDSKGEKEGYWEVEWVGLGKEQDEPEAALPFAWIRDGCKLMVKIGNQNIPYAAFAKSDPYVCDEGCWMVNVKYEGWNNNTGQDIVECSRCVRIDLTESNRQRRSRSQLQTPVGKVAGKTNSQPLRERRTPVCKTTKPKTNVVYSLGPVAGQQHCKKRGTSLISSEGGNDSVPAAVAAAVAIPRNSSFRVAQQVATGRASMAIEIDSDSSNDDDEVPRPVKESRSLWTSGSRSRHWTSQTTSNFGDRSDETITTEQLCSDGERLGSDGRGSDGDDEDDDDDLNRKPAAISSLKDRRYKESKQSDETITSEQLGSDGERFGTDHRGSDGDDEDDDDDLNRTPSAISSQKDRRYKKAKQSLCAMPGLSEQEVVNALEKVGPPYGLQTVMHEINVHRNSQRWVEPGLFEPYVGMAVQKMFNGKNWQGKVTKDGEHVMTEGENGEPAKEVMMWEVTFEDGEKEDMELGELLRCSSDRPRIPAPCRGRQLQCLELFCGTLLLPPLRLVCIRFHDSNTRGTNRITHPLYRSRNRDARVL
jgi:hypothetical protein